MLVKHYKGRFSSNLRASLYVFWHLLFRDEVEVRFSTKEFGGMPVDHPEYDWLKICGWKSGIDTHINREQMAVYRRNKFGQVETAIYNRYPGGKFEVSNVVTHILCPDIVMVVKRPKGCWIPCTPWAGGTHKPKSNYSYNIKFLL